MDSVDHRIREEAVAHLVSLSFYRPLGDMRCEHLVAPSAKYQLGQLVLADGGMREFRMCCECYQKLRDAGLATQKGTWED